MAISDREISALQEKLTRRYGSEVLLLNGSDQIFLSQNGFVTGSDTLNTDVWVEYRTNNEVADGTPFRFEEYLSLLTKLGIIGNREIKKLTKRKARKLRPEDLPATEVEKIDQYKQLVKGRALFTPQANLKGVKATLSGSTTFINYADLSASVKSELDSKMIESDEILEIKKPVGGNTSDLSYILMKEGREVGIRSMKAQGFKIQRKNLRSNKTTRGTRGRFNVFNDNQEQYYASGSWKTNGGGPRIQGPSGGPGSAKFIIIHRSGSL